MNPIILIVRIILSPIWVLLFLAGMMVFLFALIYSLLKGECNLKAGYIVFKNFLKNIMLYWTEENTIKNLYAKNNDRGIKCKK